MQEKGSGGNFSLAFKKPFFLVLTILLLVVSGVLSYFLVQKRGLEIQPKAAYAYVACFNNKGDVGSPEGFWHGVSNGHVVGHYGFNVSYDASKKGVPNRSHDYLVKLVRCIGDDCADRGSNLLDNNCYTLSTNSEGWGQINWDFDLSRWGDSEVCYDYQIDVCEDNVCGNPEWGMRYRSGKVCVTPTLTPTRTPTQAPVPTSTPRLTATPTIAPTATPRLTQPSCSNTTASCSYNNGAYTLQMNYRFMAANLGRAKLGTECYWFDGDSDTDVLMSGGQTARVGNTTGIQSCTATFPRPHSWSPEDLRARLYTYYDLNNDNRLNAGEPFSACDARRNGGNGCSCQATAVCSYPKATITPTPTPLPSCLRLEVYLSTSSGITGPLNASSLAQIKKGDVLIFKVVFNNRVENVGLRLVNPQRIDILNVSAGQATTNSWDYRYVVPQNLGGDYQVYGYLKINGVWR